MADGWGISNKACHDLLPKKSKDAVIHSRQSTSILEVGAHAGTTVLQQEFLLETIWHIGTTQ